MTVRALHLIAAMIWTGGIVFLGLAVGAARKTVSESERIELFRALGRRFALVGGIALVVLIATGTDMAGERLPDWSALSDSDYGHTLRDKLGLVAVVVALTLYHSLVQGPQMSRLREQARQHPDDDALAQRIRRKAAVSGVLQMLILIATLAIVVLAAKLVTG